MPKREQKPWWQQRVTRITAGLVLIGALLTALVGVLENAAKLRALLTPSAPAVVAVVEVQPGQRTMYVKDTVSLSAIVKDTQGATRVDRPVIWSSAQASVAQVSDTGMVTGVAPGTTTIIATTDKATGYATVTVERVPLKALVLFPPRVSLKQGTTLQLEAIPWDAQDNAVTDHPVEWRSEQDSIATVTPVGLVTAVSAGDATIVARSDLLVQSAVITVTPEPPAQPTANKGSDAHKSIIAALAPRGARSTLATTVLLPQVTLLNAPGIANCAGKLRLLFGDILIEPVSQRADIMLPAGPTRYTAGGSLICPTGTLYLTGTGMITVSNGSVFSITTRSNSPHQATVTLN